MKWKDEYDKFITSLYGRYSYIKTYEESKVKQELFVKEIYEKKNFNTIELISFYFLFM